MHHQEPFDVVLVVIKRPGVYTGIAREERDLIVAQLYRPSSEEEELGQA